MELPLSIVSDLEKAIQLRANGKTAKATAVLAAAVLKTTENHYLKYLSGNLLFSWGETDLALPMLENALISEANNIDYWTSYIRALDLSGQLRDVNGRLAPSIVSTYYSMNSTELKHQVKSVLENQENLTRDKKKLNNLIKSWSSSLELCTSRTEPRNAIKELQEKTNGYLDLVMQYPENFAVQKLAINTATFPLSVRKTATKNLLKLDGAHGNLPDFLSIRNNWQEASNKMDAGLRVLVFTAIKNMCDDELYVIEGSKITEKAHHNQGNTVIIYIQPRYFVLQDPKFIPHENSTQVFKSILKVLEMSNISILPLPLPYTNIMPTDDFPEFGRIGHHTFGHNKNSAHIKIAYLEDYSYVDGYGFGPFSEMPSIDFFKSYMSNVGLKDVNRFYEKIYGQYCINEKSKFTQGNDIINIKYSKNNIFYPMQTPDDTVMQASCLTQYQAIEIILDQIQGTKQLLLVKKHPMDTSDESKEFLKRIKNNLNCQVVDANIHGLIRSSGLIVCTNSGVGLEALLHLKRVITIGRSDYEWATERVSSEAALIKQISQSGVTANPLNIKKFIYYFLNKHVCHINDDQAILKKLSSLLRALGSRR